MASRRCGLEFHVLRLGGHTSCPSGVSTHPVAKKSQTHESICDPHRQLAYRRRTAVVSILTKHRMASGWVRGRGNTNMRKRSKIFVSEEIC